MITSKRSVPAVEQVAFAKGMVEILKRVNDAAYVPVELIDELTYRDICEFFQPALSAFGGHSSSLNPQVVLCLQVERTLRKSHLSETELLASINELAQFMFGLDEEGPLNAQNQSIAIKAQQFFETFVSLQGER